MANKKAAGWWTVGLIVSFIGGVASLIGLAASDPEAAGTLIGAASKASRPHPYRKIKRAGFWGDTVITEYW